MTPSFPTRERSLLGAIALPLLLFTSACVIGSQSHTQVEGRRVSQATLDSIRPGQSKDYVLALLGDPTRATPNEEGREVWRWEYRTVKRSEGAILFVLSSDTKHEEAGAVLVEFLDGRVLRCWRD